MKIIKEGNSKIEYIFDCDVCGCIFSLSVTEFAEDNWASKCPCCGNMLGKNTAYKDVKGLYKKEEKKDAES